MWERIRSHPFTRKDPSIDTLEPDGSSTRDPQTWTLPSMPASADHKRGEKYWSTGPFDVPEGQPEMMDLLLSREEALEGLTYKRWSGPGFFRIQFWCCWAYIFAFELQHSVIECPAVSQPLRHVPRRADDSADHAHPHQLQRVEFGSPIPRGAYLEKKGVRSGKGHLACATWRVDEGPSRTFSYGTLVYDDQAGAGASLTRITWCSSPTARDGPKDHVGRQRHRRRAATAATRATWACSTSGKKLAARRPKFGRPKPFISDVEDGFYT